MLTGTKIALAHFCDNHGPTSILCTQALPAPCFSCSPSSHSTFSSFEDDHGLHSTSPTKASSPIVPAPTASSTPVLSFSDVIDPPTAESPPSTAIPPHSAPFTKPTDTGPTPRVVPRTTRTATSSSSSAPECINCSINLPPHLTDPHHSPPSTSSSTSTSGKPAASPTLRTKLPIRIYDDPESGYCSSSSSPSRPSSPTTTFPSSSTSTSKPLYTGRSSPRHPHHHHSSNYNYSPSAPHHLTPPTAPNSYTSAHTTSTFDTTASSVLAPGQPWHDHQITYLSTHHPLSAVTYASMRRSIVRTLSGEVLPRGCTAGPIYFTTASPSAAAADDAEERAAAAISSTIAYTFRLADKHARGGYRVYSLIALAASADVADVYGVVAPVWRRFEGVSKWIAGMVEGEARRRDLVEAGGLGGEEEEEEESGGLEVGRKKQDKMRRGKGAGDRGSDETVKTKSIGTGGAGIGPPSAGSFLTGGAAQAERRGGSSYFGPGMSGQSGGIGIGGGRGVGAGLRGRGLVEICGDKEIFARLHWSFVDMLKEFGGMQIVETSDMTMYSGMNVMETMEVEKED